MKIPQLTIEKLQVFIFWKKEQLFDRCDEVVEILQQSRNWKKQNHAIK